MCRKYLIIFYVLLNVKYLNGLSVADSLLFSVHWTTFAWFCTFVIVSTLWVTRWLQTLVFKPLFYCAAWLLLIMLLLKNKGVFIATQLNSTSSWVELSCVAIDRCLHVYRHNSTQLNWPSWTAYSDTTYSVQSCFYDVTTYKLSQLGHYVYW